MERSGLYLLRPCADRMQPVGLSRPAAPRARAQSRAWLYGITALLLTAQPVAGELCRAAAVDYPQGWSVVAAPPDRTAALRLDVLASCTDCQPVVFAEIFAGQASAQFRSMPIAQRVGLDFAQTIVSDPALRVAYESEFLEAERRASPGCDFDARTDGIATIASLPMIATSVRAECVQAPGKVRAAYFSGFDGQCLFRVRFLWPGWSPLAIETQQRIETFMEQLRFSR